jgi:hypothetical protein
MTSTQGIANGRTAGEPFVERWATGHHFRDTHQSVIVAID